MTHLLVTNDFPPKIGGIQNYLYELWRRLDPQRFAVLTSRGTGAAAFDREQPFRIERVDTSMLLPTPTLRHRIERLAGEIDAQLVVLDPALPIGAIGPSLSRPYALVLHGAEVTVPARLPVSSGALRRTLERAALIIAAGRYPAREAQRLTRGAQKAVIVPPGVDTGRFRPLSATERIATRAALEVDEHAQLVVSVSRLVPRKGMDVLIEASAALKDEHPDLVVVIAGAGRDRERLERVVQRRRAPVRFLGRVEDEFLPYLLGAADVFAMFCRNRWGGLEQEGFGIVFLEAAACGVVPIAGRSGGADEAVLDERTGLVVDRPGDVFLATRALARLLGNAELRAQLAGAARVRAVEEFDYAVLATTLSSALEDHGG